jgi:hypothetical protein
MRKLLFAIFTLIVNVGFCQSLSVSPNQLSFPATTELEKDSLAITITNTLGKDIHITGYRFYNTYSSIPFSTNAGTTLVPNGGSVQLWILFQPSHNILHNSELFILNDSYKGALKVDLIAQGRYSIPYYNSTENKVEEVLKQELKTITGVGYVSLIYGPARDSMFMIYDNKKVNGQGATQNTIECVYTGRNAVGYIDRTDCQNLTTYSFNTEHTFPQGFFTQLEPMRSDLFHLYPSDDDANNKRASFPFGVVTNPTWSVGGSKLGNNIFEPRDFAKGRIARSMFYFVTRYQNYSNFLDTQEGILRQWCTAFPADQIEKDRAADITSAQNNRNPYIDYPQLLERINSLSTTSIAPQNGSSDFPVDTIDFGLVNGSNLNTYTFWIMNDGNQVLNYYNLSLIPISQLSFLNGTGVNGTINPGEAKAITIQLANATPGTFSGSFPFVVSSVNFTAIVNIPIRANVSLTSIAENEKTISRVYPNPFSNEICISNKNNISSMKLYSLMGQEILKTSFDESNSVCTSVENAIPSGSYIIEITSGNLISRQLLLKK